MSCINDYKSTANNKKTIYLFTYSNIGDGMDGEGENHVRQNI